VDFAYPELKVFIEIDGREFHGTAEAFHNDHTRLTELTMMGWRHPLLFTAKHLRGDPRFVERSIRTTLALASSVGA
jgi:very-short-patch-repair endonuclease